ncbi:MAG: TauD/TfdA family dioxygenase [Pirellulaceae bacterium]
MTDVITIATIQVPGQQQCQGTIFPLVLEPVGEAPDLDATINWLGGQASILKDQAASHGAILFRGFSLQTDRDFDRFITAFELENFPYRKSLSNAVRINRTERVFTANESPPEVNIYLHHELAQTPFYPSHLFFFCEKPAGSGGATSLCRSDELWSRLEEVEPEFAAACRGRGLLYSSTMPAEDDPDSGMGRSWQSTFRAETREGAEQRMGELDYSWQWLADGGLRATTPVLPAVRELDTGRTSFFNQLIAAYQGWSAEGVSPDESITFGDGSRLDGAAVQTAVEIAESLSFDIPWQQGDVALVDNYVCMHGRRTFQGERKILASLAR